MTGQGTELDPELLAFLTPRKIQRTVPADLRARVLASARVRLGLNVSPPARPPETPVRPMVRHRLFRMAVAALLVIVGAAAGAAAALHGRRAQVPEGPVVASLPPPSPPTRTGAVGVRRAAPTPEPEAAAPKRAHVPRSGAKSDPFTAELELLQQAQREFTRHHHAATLALVAEHARRFPNGHLAEQREALRVRSLAGGGRTDEARRVAAAFALRFPRSVLLPRAEDAEPSLESSPR